MTAQEILETQKLIEWNYGYIPDWVYINKLKDHLAGLLSLRLKLAKDGSV